MNLVQQAYNSWSHNYDHDANRTRDLDQQVTAQLLSGQHVNTVLKLGCGTGKNTRLLAQIAQHVQALDFSEGMLAQAQAKLQAAGVANVTWKQADLTKPWPYSDQSINLIVCNLVLEHIEDLDVIFQQARRCLTARGRFFICELHPFQQYIGKQARFQTEQGETLVPAYQHHFSDFMHAAQDQGFNVLDCGEWWHADDAGNHPRLISFLFQKS